MKRVLFVCTGNTCRSPMAEALLRHHGEGKFEVQSAVRHDRLQFLFQLKLPLHVP
ncbi:arsenate-mycothiol transferase ArsC, partial [Bacillus sp. D-CC]